MRAAVDRFPIHRDCSAHPRITGDPEIGHGAIKLTYNALTVEVGTSLHMSGLPTSHSCGFFGRRVSGVIGPLARNNVL